MNRSYCSGEKNFFAMLTNKQVERLRTLRIKKNYTQQKLGDIFRVSQQSVSRYLNYERYK